MTVNRGHELYASGRARRDDDHDAATIKRSNIARGRAEYAARTGDSTARDALHAIELEGEHGTDVDTGGDAA